MLKWEQENSSRGKIMNRFRLNILTTIVVAYFLTIASTTTYALWGISTATAIAVSTVIGCLGYEHKRIDDLNNRVREQGTTQRRTSTDMQTLASNVSTLANNVSTVASTVQVHVTQQLERSHDLQNAYDNQSSEEGYNAPAPLPRVVLAQAPEHTSTLPMPAQHE